EQRNVAQGLPVPHLAEGRRREGVEARRYILSAASDSARPKNHRPELNTIPVSIRQTIHSRSEIVPMPSTPYLNPLIVAAIGFSASNHAYFGGSFSGYRTGVRKSQNPMT